MLTGQPKTALFVCCETTHGADAEFFGLHAASCSEDLFRRAKEVLVQPPAASLGCALGPLALTCWASALDLSACSTACHNTEPFRIGWHVCCLCISFAGPSPILSLFEGQRDAATSDTRCKLIRQTASFEILDELVGRTEEAFVWSIRQGLSACRHECFGPPRRDFTFNLLDFFPSLQSWLVSLTNLYFFSAS